MWASALTLVIGCTAKQNPADSVPDGSTSDSDTDRPTHTDTDASDTSVDTSPVTDSGAPAPLAWVSISAGASPNTCGVLSDGRLICFGSGYGGVVAEAPVTATWSAVGVGGENACALDLAGMPTCWGCESYADTGDCSPPAEPFVRLEVDAFLGCGERTDGTVSCWGIIPLPGRPRAAEMGGPFRDFDAGNDAFCTLDPNSGAPTCLDGQDLGGMNAPPPGLDLASIAVGQNHACGLRSADGTGVCWGSDGFLQPMMQPPPGAFVAIESRAFGTCLLAADGSITCFHPDYPTPAAPPPGSYTMLTVGGLHGCAIDNATGEMVCWGGQGAGEADPPLLADLVLP